MKVQISDGEIGKLLKKYKPYLTKHDIGKIINEQLANPSKDVNEITEKYLEKKFAIDQITDLIEKSESEDVPFDMVMKKLKISKTRFYFRLNYIKRHYLKKQIDLIVKKGKFFKKTKSRKGNLGEGYQKVRKRADCRKKQLKETRPG